MTTIPLWTGTAVPRLGLGTWAMGGIWTAGGGPAGWGPADDAVSLRVLRAAADAGLRLVDTAQAYGAGHAERLIGQALHDRPDLCVATKVGYAIDEDRRALLGEAADPAAIRASVDASRRRLRRDRIDLLLLHLNALPVEQARPVFDTLEDLRAEGWIDRYGWSTDFPDRAAAFADRPAFVAVEHAMNVFFRADGLMPVIEAAGLLSLARSPLAMGVLGGRHGPETRFGADDIRSQTHDWMEYFRDGGLAPETAARLGAVREVLMQGGRTLAQGALGWLWARSAATMPIPGIRTEAQLADLTGALAHGPLPEATMAEVERLVARPPEGPPRER